MKICTKCKQAKIESEFYVHKLSKKDGLTSWCKTCINALNRSPEANLKKKKYRDSIRGKAKASAYMGSASGKLSSYRASARRRGIQFSLTLESMDKMLNDSCFYCGRKSKSMGVDRVDCKIGYVPGNMVPCCSMCNYMKLDFSLTEFIDACKLVAKNFGTENVRLVPYGRMLTKYSVTSIGGA